MPYTPRSKIRSALRKWIWLRSRERASALKREGYRCQECKQKQSKAKGKELYVEVHHLDGTGIDKLIDCVYEYLLHNPDRLKVLCEDCHEKEKSHDRT